jgi:hypothetical protein
MSAKYKHHLIKGFNEHQREIRKLRTSIRNFKGKNGCINSGDMISVDYFALSALLDYVDESYDTLLHLTKLRIILD